MGNEGGGTVEEIALATLAEMDAPGDGGGEPAAEAVPSPEPGSDGTSDDGSDDGSGSADGAGETPSDDGPSDFLHESGVSLEQVLEGIEDPSQRAFLETRYKQMQADYTRKTQQLAQQRNQQTQAEPEGVAALKSEVETLRGLLGVLAQRPQQPQQMQQPQQPVDQKQRFIHAGITEPVSVEDAITDPTGKTLMKLIEQVTTMKARENDYLLLQQINQRFAPVEATVQQAAIGEAKNAVAALFSEETGANVYRTPENEQAIVAVMEKYPGMPLEAAFQVVIGPQVQADAYKFGQRVGAVSQGGAQGVSQDVKRQMSVPRGGGGSAAEPVEIPRGASVEEIWRLSSQG